MRLFLAIHLSDPAIEHLRKVQSLLRPIAPDMNFTRDVNLHLTVKFLGEVAPDRLDGIRKAISTVAEGGELKLAATGFVAFPPTGNANVIAARIGGESADQLGLLASALDRALRSHGVEPEQRRFNPHVTLARAGRAAINIGLRVRMEQTVKKLWPGPTFAARYLHLMESELSQTGPKYRAVSQFDLFGENSV